MLTAALEKMLKPFVPRAFRQFVRVRFLRNVPDISAENKPPEWEYQQFWNVGLSAQGWNDPSVAEMQRSKWGSFVQSLSGSEPYGVSHEAPADAGNRNLWAHNLIATYGYVLGLAAHKRDRLSMLDWGGGIGHYAVINKCLMPGVTVEYHCEDMPTLCRVGRSLLPEGTFYDDPGRGFDRQYDLVHAGSSLWYSEDWRETATKLASSAEEYLYVTRMMFVQNVDSYVVLQRPHKYGYNTEYQCWILNQAEFVNHICERGFTLVREFLFGPGPPIANAPEQGFFKGFLFRRSVLSV